MYACPALSPTSAPILFDPVATDGYCPCGQRLSDHDRVELPIEPLAEVVGRPDPGPPPAPARPAIPTYVEQGYGRRDYRYPTDSVTIAVATLAAVGVAIVVDDPLLVVVVVLAYLLVVALILWTRYAE